MDDSRLSIMKVSHARAILFSLLVLPVLIANGQEPSVPKLPHVTSGKLTKSGSDYTMPGPKEGYVPDKETAIKIAEVVLFRLYGEQNIIAQRPYVSVEDENIWWVCGTVHSELGSEFKIAISKQTAAVLYLER
jgi:hypothetical protein